jgi:hypothetical protein
MRRAIPSAAIDAMVSLLEPHDVAMLARTLQAHLSPSGDAVRRRVEELGLLARVLEEVPQQPGLLPYVDQARYERRRVAADAAAPSARDLSERYGGWRRACYAAWGLGADGRKWAPGQAWPWAVPGTPHAATYTVEECVESWRRCRAALGRDPSSGDYHAWRQVERLKTRQERRQVRVASVEAILRELAPDRTPRAGWRIASARARVE